MSKRPLFEADDLQDMRELSNAVQMIEARTDQMIDRITKRESDRPLFPPRTADWR